MALAKLRHFAAHQRNGSDTGDERDMVALLPISSHPQQHQHYLNGGSVSNLEHQQQLHQTLNNSRLSVLHSNMAQISARQSSAGPNTNNHAVSGPQTGGLASSSHPQELQTTSPRSKANNARPGGALFAAHSASAAPFNTTLPTLFPFQTTGGPAQAAAQSGSRSSPLPRGARAGSPHSNATDFRRGGASSSYLEGYGPTDGGQSKATRCPDSPRGSVREYGPARQRNEREGDRHASKDLPVARKNTGKGQVMISSISDSSSQPPL